jgi:hypothetical protein
MAAFYLLAMEKKALVVYLLESNNEALKNKKSEVS